MVDFLECQYCACPLEPNAYQHRLNWWQASGLPYLQAVQQFNTQYQVFYHQQQNFLMHQQSEQHMKALQSYSKLVDELSKLLARFETANSMLDSMVRACQEQIARGDSKTSWYILTQEESFSWRQNVDDMMKYTLEMISNMQIQNLHRNIGDLTTKSINVQAFTVQKREEEKSMIDEMEREAQEEDVFDDEDEDIAGDDIVLKALGKKR